MKMAICRCGENGTISIQGAGERSRMFRAGDSVDLDEIIVQETKDRPAQTVGDALGRYASMFELDKPKTKTKAADKPAIGNETID